jgi:protein-tyrosine-phosphatase/predicted choloylglycine hydrolase
MTAGKRIVFVCVENSNRSQMAEAFARIYCGTDGPSVLREGKIEAVSAGSRPSGRVNPKAIAAMAELGYDLNKHQSKALADLPDTDYDVAVTMGCGDQCPMLRARERLDWNIPDPRDMTPEQFRGVRDLIGQKVKELLARLQGAVNSFPLLQAQGSPRQLGRQHGEQCRVQLRAFLDYLGATLKLTRTEIERRASRFLPLFETHCPHLVEEVRGLAEGAGVGLAEALAVQIRGEMGQVTAEACTTFVISGRGTAAGQILIGQNSDMDPEIEDTGYVLSLEPAGKPALLMWTFGGQIGYHGMNAAGVAHFANALGGGPAWKFGLPHYPIKRMMLECQTLPQVFDLLRSVPVCSSGNYVLCDGDGRIADVELTPDGFSVIEDTGSGFITHTNHFLCGPHDCAANRDVSVPDSFPRLERIRALVGGKFGSLTAEDMKGFLADHAGQPTSICRHPHAGPDHPSVSARGRTVASLIAEPAAGRLHVSRGNPCTAGYHVYSLGASQSLESRL